MLSKHIWYVFLWFLYISVSLNILFDLFSSYTPENFPHFLVETIAGFPYLYTISDFTNFDTCHNIIQKYRLSEKVKTKINNTINDAWFLYDNTADISIEAALLFDLTLYKLRNVYQDYEGSIITQSDVFTGRQWYYKSGIPPNKIYFFREVVSIIHMFHGYGHTIRDNIPALLSIPTNILKNKTIIINGWFNDVYAFLDFDISRFLLIGKSELVYSETLFTFVDYALLNHEGPLYLKLCKIIKKNISHYNSDHFRYVLVNRCEQMRRHIKNFGVLAKYVMHHFPTYKWEEYDNVHGGIKETLLVSFIFWNQVKFLILSIGTNTANAVAMRKNSAVCVISAILYDSAIMHRWDYNSFLLNQIWAYFIICKQMHHVRPSSIVINANYIIHPIKNLLYAMNHHKWMSHVSLSSYPEVYYSKMNYSEVEAQYLSFYRVFRKEVVDCPVHISFNT